MGPSFLHSWTASVPRPAFVLGFAGLIPFIAATVMLLFGGEAAHPIWHSVLLGYGVAILSFMGGVDWGLAMRQDERRNWLRYGASVVPALVAWIAFLLPKLAQFPVLAAGFILALICDLSLVKSGEAPAWYRNLRWPLTVVVVACLSLASTV